MEEREKGRREGEKKGGKGGRVEGGRERGKGGWEGGRGERHSCHMAPRGKDRGLFS